MGNPHSQLPRRLRLASSGLNHGTWSWARRNVTQGLGAFVRWLILVLPAPVALWFASYVALQGHQPLLPVCAFAIGFIAFGAKRAVDNPMKLSTWIFGSRPQIAWVVLRAMLWVMGLTLTGGLVFYGRNPDRWGSQVETAGGLPAAFLLEGVAFWLSGLAIAMLLLIVGTTTRISAWRMGHDGTVVARYLWETTTAPQLRAIQAGLLIGSLLLVLGAMGCASNEKDLFGPHLGDRPETATEPGLPTVRLDTTGRADLLRGFSPVLIFHSRELWPPQGVDKYLREATAFNVPGVGRLNPPLTIETLRQHNTACANTSTACSMLEVHCPVAPCLAEKVTGHNVRREGTVYGRVLRSDRNKKIDWTPAPAFRGQRVTMLLQWWLFYAYDDWNQQLLLGGRIDQQHAADWEVVSMGLSDVGPLFVALSSHCGGVWADWGSDQIFVYDKADDKRDPVGPRLHPEIAVAKGSHAMYFDAYIGRAPDALACNNHELSRIAGLASYAANVRDLTGARVGWFPDVAPLADSRVVLNFPAVWSARDSIKLNLGGLAVDLSESMGPEAPRLHDIFKQPLETIFCDSAWNRGDGPNRRQNCR